MEHNIPSNNQSAGDSVAFDFVLSNKPIEYNCYLNSIVQAVWHTKGIANTLLSFKDNSSDEAKVVQALIDLFTEAKEQNKAIQLSLDPKVESSFKPPELKPDAIRVELFKQFYATQNPEKFDLYKKADAGEFL